MRVKVSRHLRRRQADRIERATLKKGAVSPSTEGKKLVRMRGRGGGIVYAYMTVYGGGGGDLRPIVPRYDARGIETGAEIEISGSAWKESMAHTVDQLLGFNVVPPTYLRKTKTLHEDARGVAVQRWIPGAKTLGIANNVNEEDLMKIFIFDIIVGHVDRHTHNIVVEKKSPYHAWAIDNETIMGVYVERGHDL